MKSLSESLYAIQDVESGLIINYGFRSEKDAEKYIKFLVKECGYHKSNLILDVLTVVKNVDSLIKEVKKNIKS